VEAQIQELRRVLEDKINRQSQEIDNLKNDLSNKDARLQKAEQQAAEAQAIAKKASEAAASERQSVIENATAVATLQSTVNNVKANAVTLARNVTYETNQLKKERANPTTLYYKGVSLTPGGFIAADTVYRAKSMGSDIPTSYNNLPYQGDDRYKLSEFYGSSRPTRISLLFESKPDWGTLRGYYEADFQGAGTNSNNYQNNSYMMRQRVLYGELERNGGWKLAFGQMWSLATEGGKGIPSNPIEVKTPNTVDTNYMPGFIWARQYGVRVVKSVANGKLTFGFAAENSQLMYTASLAGDTPYAVLGSAGSTTGYNAAISSSSSTTYIKNYDSNVQGVPSAGYSPVYGTLTTNTNIANYSFNAAPDLLIKAVADPGWGHYEIFGLVGFAHETIYPGVTTDRMKYGGQYDITCPSSVSTCSPVAELVDPSTTLSDSIVLGGVGASFRVPFGRDKFSFGAKALYGPGVGRYGDSLLADVTSRADGSLAPIHNLSGLMSFEWMPTKRLTFWSNYGGDYAARDDYTDYGSNTTSTGLPAPTPCYGSYNVDRDCASPEDVNAGTLSLAAGNWGGYWGAKTKQAVGYGSRQAINYYEVNGIPAGCNITATPGYNGASTGYNASTPEYCVGHTRSAQEVTGGYYYDFYKGPYGRLRQGIQYGYAVREGWSGQTLFSTHSVPKGINNMFWTSLRYYLP
jgi:hypothetical protein